MSISTFENFDLLIDQGPAGYKARVIHSLAGDASGEFTLPFGNAELAAFLQETVGVSRDVGAAGRAAGPALDVRAFGQRLYDAVFGGAVATCLLRSLDAARRQQVGLRIRLRFDPKLADLADLPWEYLYSTDLQRYLALSDQTPVVRYLEVARAAPRQACPVRPPLSVLAVLANPRGVPELDVEREWQLLRQAVQGLMQQGLLRLERLPAATLETLQGRLRQADVHVLHFVGHGFFDAAANQGGLVFEDDKGRAEAVTAGRLAMLLHDHEPLRLAFLNACQGATSGRSDSFAGVAQRLVQQGLPAVLAMQFPVSDHAAVALSQEFYRALADGLPADTALSEARKAIAAAGDDLEWGTPVLFSRSGDNRLIELPRGDRRPVIETKDFEPETILIPAGPFLMGSPPGEGIPDYETPPHPVDLPDFRIGVYPVTVREYAAFLRDRSNQDAPRGWFLREPPAERLDHPVTDVNWLDASAYCAWLSERTGRRYRLPDEAEWEKAASWGPGERETGRPGGQQRRYPWGDEWQDGRCQAASSGTAAVDAHPAGSSAYGCHDMLGNVQEWTRALWGLRPQEPDSTFRERPAGGPPIDDPAELPALARMVHRGGSYKSQPADLRCAARGNALPDSRIAWRGFRVVMEID